MRLSKDPTDPGYMGWLYPVKVTLDGREQPHWVTADEERGYLERLRCDLHGEPTTETERKRGVVRIVSDLQWQTVGDEACMVFPLTGKGDWKAVLYDPTEFRSITVFVADLVDQMRASLGPDDDDDVPPPVIGDEL